MRGWVIAGAIALLSTLGLSSSMLPAAQGDAPGIEIPGFKEKGIANHQKAFCLYRVIQSRYSSAKLGGMVLEPCSCFG